jgi:hypothetical protein
LHDPRSRELLKISCVHFRVLIVARRATCVVGTVVAGASRSSFLALGA